MFIFRKLSAYVRLMRWHQPAGFFLVLPGSLWGLAAAANSYSDIQSSSSFSLLYNTLKDSFDPDVFVESVSQHLTMTLDFAGQLVTQLALYPQGIVLGVIITAGAFVMRSAGCVINDYWDRDLDHRVARTRKRPLTSGELKPYEGLVLFALLLILAVALVLLLNPFTGLLALIGAAGTILYPLAKKLLPVPQLALGLVFSWGTLMAWAAYAGSLGYWDPWALWAAHALWIVSYDLQYAICDSADDKKIGIKSGALFFGASTPRAIAVFQFDLLLVLVLRGVYSDAGMFYYLILAAAALFFISCWDYTEGYTNKTRCLHSFKRNHYFGWLILLAIVTQ